MMYGTNYGGYGGYPQNIGYPPSNGYYGNGGAAPDNLGQLRQQQFQQPLMQSTLNSQQGNNIDDRIWVANYTQAEAYFVVPNGFVRLWDSNQPVYYEKRCDSTGRPLPMEIFDYHRRETSSQQEAPGAQAVQPVQAVPETNNNYEKRIKELEERVKDLENSAKSNTSNNNNKKEDNKK